MREAEERAQLEAEEEDAPTRMDKSTKLVQIGITYPDGGKLKSSFPHHLKRIGDEDDGGKCLSAEQEGYLSAEQECYQWQQRSTKLTKIEMQLLNAQGAPPPRSYPHVSRPASPRPKLHRTSVAPRVCGRPASPGKHAAAGRPGASADLAQRHDWAAALGRPQAGKDEERGAARGDEGRQESSSRITADGEADG